MTEQDDDRLPWVAWWQVLLGRQCTARREPRPDDEFWGRCELVAGHRRDHALERGFDTPRWSTHWTA